ncbi:MAG: hypothetical protein PW788_13345 [Micavibrio sp.]|nr:hypothetical protein [Micavibrio sp.]
MSDARQHLKNAVQDAATSAGHFPVDKRTYFPSLWQSISGPAVSGKETLAREYAIDLRNANLLPERFPDVLSCDRAKSAVYIRDAFARATGNILIIQEADKLDSSMAVTLTTELNKAFNNQRSIVVVIGSVPTVTGVLEKLEDGPRAALLPAMLKTERSFTPAERAAFDNDRDGTLTRQDNLRHWQENPVASVTITAPVKALKPLRFRPAGNSHA